MKSYLPTIRTVWISCLILLSACAPEKPSAVIVKNNKPTVRLTLVPHETPLQAGKTVSVQAKLTHIDEQYILVPEDLKPVLDHPIHLLVIDPTLTDYQHLHPAPTQIPGLFTFEFTPKFSGGYRAWASIVPLDTGLEEFARSDLGNPKGKKINKDEVRDITTDGYRFVLSFDNEPAIGEESIGTVTITDSSSGKPLTSLDSLMGIHGHMDGFYDDFRTVTHAHLIQSADKHSLTFSLTPEKSGFLKLFAQVRTNGKILIAPFGITIPKTK